MSLPNAASGPVIGPTTPIFTVTWRLHAANRTSARTAQAIRSIWAFDCFIIVSPNWYECRLTIAAGSKN